MLNNIKKFAVISIAMSAAVLSSNAFAAECSVRGSSTSTGCTTSWVAIPANGYYKFEGVLQNPGGNSPLKSYSPSTVEFSVLRGDGAVVYLKNLKAEGGLGGVARTGTITLFNPSTTQKSYQARMKFFKPMFQDTLVKATITAGR